MKKSLISLIILISFPLLVAAGFNFGFIKTVKKKVDKVDEKVIERKEEIAIVNSNSSPVISSIVANPTTISTGAVSAITCTASDADGDNLTYTWSAASGTISGTGATINWTAPASSSAYVINVTVSDGQGGSVQSSVNVTVTKSNNPPIITSIVANPTTISTGAVSAITCTASDLDSDTLTYTWSAASGTISGTGSQINWTAPASSSTYIINITVSDGHGGSAQSSVNVGAYPHELPDTGQTQSFTATFGEDHDYQPVATQMSYADNGDGTTTDTRTGLMWVKDGNSAGCNNGTQLSWEQALTFCEGLSYAGYSDWRLPNKRELFSIVDFGTSSPAINTTYFPNTVTYSWTSTTNVLNTIYAWAVNFNSGTVVSYGKTSGNYVRCVLAGP